MNKELQHETKNKLKIINKRPLSHTTRLKLITKALNLIFLYAISKKIKIEFRSLIIIILIT